MQGKSDDLGNTMYDAAPVDAACLPVLRASKWVYLDRDQHIPDSVMRDQCDSPLTVSIGTPDAGPHHAF